jgi:hypothetical protein
MMVNKHAIVLTILSTCWVISGLKVQGFDDATSYDFSEALLRAKDDLEPLAFVQLELHEDTPTPPFSGPHTTCIETSYTTHIDV